MGFIAGRYTATLGSDSLGQTADGYRISHQFFKQLIKGDAFGETTQDAVYRGGDMEIAMTLLEYNAAGAQNAMWPYASTLLDLGVIGRCDVASSIADSLILTAVTGTTAAAAPASITLPKSILKEGFPVELLFAPALRDIPLRMRIYPNSSGVFGTLT